MSPQRTLELRKEELRRRVDALPSELGAWQKRARDDLDSQLHFSQLQAIGVLMETFTRQQKTLLAALDPNGNADQFLTSTVELVKNIIRSQELWDFFRDKLDLRFSPTFKEVLWVADTVAWNCYRPVLDLAAGLGIIPATELREPPLTYLTAEFSAATWWRGSQPDRHWVSSSLPIPVIELPWDHVENIWEFLSLCHEVGHDLEFDLKLREPLTTSLRGKLQAGGVPDDRLELWLKWQAEVFADLVGLQLGGPFFTETLMHLLILPKPMVTALNLTDTHPPHYLRILMNAAYIPTLIENYAPLENHGAQIADRWLAIYGQQPQFSKFKEDFPMVFEALMDTQLIELAGNKVPELMPYKEADDKRIRGAVDYLLTGKNKPGKLEPRHCVSAARLALTQAAQAGSVTDAVLNQINQKTMELVRNNAVGGLRGGDGSTPHKQFIASFADKWNP